jgi:hypothetical protein
LIAIVLKLFYVMIMNYKSQAASKVIEYKSWLKPTVGHSWELFVCDCFVNVWCDNRVPLNMILVWFRNIYI